MKTLPFEFVKLDSLNFDLNAVTTESGRIYETPDGRKYPSITTVLSGASDKTFLEEWKKRVGEEEANRIVRKSSNRGTNLHTACEQYLLNELTSFRMQKMMPDVKEFFLQLRPHIDANVGKVYGIEQPLYSHNLGIAGRCDCIAEWNGKLSIIDYKNSRKEKKEEWIQNYFIQCTAYAEMFGEITGMEIEQIVVAIAVEDGQPQIFTKTKHKYLPELWNCIEVYRNKQNVVL